MAREPETETRPELADLDLIDFIPAISPRWKSPYHLLPYVNILQGVIDGTIKDGRFVVRCPVRHGKTETTLHAIALMLGRRPTSEIFYVSYGATFAHSKNRKARRIYQEIGSLSKDHNTISEWHTSEDGFVLATGVDGVVTGNGADLIILDDPIKSREEAMSSIVRDVASDFVDELSTRLNPGGTIIIVASRFHVDDPSGRKIREGWTDIHLRAIEDEGLPTERALWPEVRPIEHLKKIRQDVKEYLWFANYQGEPRPPGTSVFSTPGRYAAIPDGMRVTLGSDLAYSGGKRNDHFACVAIGEYADKFYVLNVDRFKARIDVARERLRSSLSRYPGVHCYSYVSGTEKGPIILLQEDGICIQAMNARYNKLVRAQRLSDAWNRGDVLVPLSNPPWLAPFLGEMASFTGQDDTEDDQVDAIVSAFDGATGQRGNEWTRNGFTFGSRVM